MIHLNWQKNLILLKTILKKKKLKNCEKNNLLKLIEKNIYNNVYPRTG